MLDYTRKVGETSAVKKIFDFLNQQKSVAQTIASKEKDKQAYAIGEDHTLDDLRETIAKGVKNNV